MTQPTRRDFLLASAGACPSATGLAAASDWEQRLGDPTGWSPNRPWTDEAYRVGNSSGGFERMGPGWATSPSSGTA